MLIYEFMRMMRKGTGRKSPSRHSHGYSHFSHRSKGFSLTELLLVIGIASIITLIVSGAFSKAVESESLSKKTAIVLSLLERARSLTLSAKNASVYGVHFEADKAVLFGGASYVPNASSNTVEPIGGAVRISSIALAGGGSDVVFKRLTGETAQSGKVTLSLTASSTRSKTITIFQTGIASSD